MPETVNAPGTSGVPPGLTLDVCRLLTSSEIEGIQGEPVKETKAGEHRNGSLLVSQCFFTTRTFNRSVTLQVTQQHPGPSGTEAVRDVWREKFSQKAGRNEEAENEREREREKGRGQGRPRERESEEGEHGEAEKVGGIGDEAYWVGGRFFGALYVLEGDRILMISVGGPDEQPTKVNKTRELARLALKRL